MHLICAISGQPDPGLNGLQPLPMKTFYNKAVLCRPPTLYASANCTPYATTALMAQSNLLNKLDSASRPIQTDP